MKIVIVDDEEASAKEIKKMLVKFFPKFDICGTYMGVNEAMEGINKTQPDLVFLDIELDENQTGFDLLEKISPRLFEVIFITAYNKFAIRAFQYSALHYLIKPLEEVLFVQAVNRAVETKNMKDYTKRFDIMLNNMQGEQSLPRKIMIPNLKSDGWLYLDVEQIVRVDSDGRQSVRITYKEENEYLFTGMRKNIGEIEKMLDGHDFIRVHESHIVNASYIKAYLRDKKVLVMRDKQIVEVSRRNLNILMEKLKKF